MKVIIVASLIAAGCQSSEEVGDIADTHNVIALLPLTGSFAGKGPEHLKAIQKGFADLEAAGGLDKPIRVFVIDAANNDSNLAAERLATQLDELTLGPNRHVAAIISSTTGAMKGSAPTALVEGIPYFEISSGSGLDEVTLTPEADRHYSFALRPLCMPEPDVTAELLAARASTPGWERIFVARGSQAHDKMHTRELRTAMTTRGQAPRIVNDTDVEMPNTGPFEAHIDAAIAAGADVIYFHLNGDSNNLAFLQAAERQGFTGKIVTCGMARSTTLLHATDPGVAPYLSSNKTDEGRLFFAMRGPVTNANYDAFKRDFLAYSEYSADTFSPAGYDAAVLIGLGIAAAKTSEAEPLRAAISASASVGKKVNYGELAVALRAAKAGEDIDYDGASGSLDLTFDDVLGNVAVGRYYIETMIKKPSQYEYAQLVAPDDVR